MFNYANPERMRCDQPSCLLDLLRSGVSIGLAATRRFARRINLDLALGDIRGGRANTLWAEIFGLGGFGWWELLGWQLSPTVIRIRHSSYMFRSKAQLQFLSYPTSNGAKSGR